MSQKALLGIIAIVLIAILGVLVYESQKKTPAERMADSVKKAMEEVGETVSKEAEEVERRFGDPR